MDIQGGQLTQTNGNPIWPAASSTGPLVAGNVLHGDGVSALAGAGEQIGGAANAGYAMMGQFSPITQAASSVSGGTTTAIVIPAQSMIVQILAYVTTAWTGGSTTFTVTDTASNSYATAGPGNLIGIPSVLPPATKSVIQQWENVGNTDVQIVVTSANTGSGVGMLYVRYLQGCNSAKSA